MNAERSGNLWEHRRNTADMLASATLVGQAARVRSWGLVTAQVLARPVQARRGGVLADVGNHLPAVKAAIDGLVKAGMLVDDDPEHLVYLAFLPPVRADKGRPTGVDLIIRSG